MAETETTEPTRAGGTGPAAHLNETALRGEIAFWREMIACGCDSLPPEAKERMHQALALAEHRLAGLYEIHAQGQNVSANVYRLETSRKSGWRSDVQQGQANVRLGQARSRGGP